MIAPRIWLVAVLVVFAVAIFLQYRESQPKPKTAPDPKPQIIQGQKAYMVYDGKKWRIADSEHDTHAH